MSGRNVEKQKPWKHPSRCAPSVADRILVHQKMRRTSKYSQMAQMRRDKENVLEILANNKTNDKIEGPLEARLVQVGRKCSCERLRISAKGCKANCAKCLGLTIACMRTTSIIRARRHSTAYIPICAETGGGHFCKRDYWNCCNPAHPGSVCPSHQVTVHCRTRYHLKPTEDQMEAIAP